MGAQQLPINVKEATKKADAAWQTLTWYRSARSFSVITGQMKMFDFDDEHFYPAKEAIDMYHRYKEEHRAIWRNGL